MSLRVAKDARANVSLSLSDDAIGKEPTNSLQGWTVGETFRLDCSLPRAPVLYYCAIRGSGALPYASSTASDACPYSPRHTVGTKHLTVEPPAAYTRTLGPS